MGNWLNPPRVLTLGEACNNQVHFNKTSKVLSICLADNIRQFAVPERMRPNEVENSF